MKFVQIVLGLLLLAGAVLAIELPFISGTSLLETDNYYQLSNENVCIQVFKDSQGYQKLFKADCETEMVYYSSWVLEYWKEAGSKWNQITVPVEVSVEEVAGGFVVTQYGHDWAGTEFNVSFDLRDNDELKVATWIHSGETRVYQIHTNFDGVVGEEWLHESQSHKFKSFSGDTNETDFSFDYSDVFNSFGNKTKVTNSTSANGRKIDVFFGNFSIDENEELFLDPTIGGGDLPYTIYLNNTAYDLTANISTGGAWGVKFGNATYPNLQNTTLDCEGFKITVTVDNPVVWFEGGYNNTIKNCYLEMTASVKDYVVDIQSGLNHTIFNNTFILRGLNGSNGGNGGDGAWGANGTNSTADIEATNGSNGNNGNPGVAGTAGGNITVFRVEDSNYTLVEFNSFNSITVGTGGDGGDGGDGGWGGYGGKGWVQAVPFRDRAPGWGGDAGDGGVGGAGASGGIFTFMGIAGSSFFNNITNHTIGNVTSGSNGEGGIAGDGGNGGASGEVGDLCTPPQCAWCTAQGYTAQNDAQSGDAGSGGTSGAGASGVNMSLVIDLQSHYGNVLDYFRVTKVASSAFGVKGSPASSAGSIGARGDLCGTAGSAGSVGSLGADGEQGSSFGTTITSLANLTITRFSLLYAYGLHAYSLLFNYGFGTIYDSHLSTTGANSTVYSTSASNPVLWSSNYSTSDLYAHTVSNITAIWDVYLHVVDAFGDVANANVNCTNNNGTSIFKLTTNATGWIETNLTEFYINTTAGYNRTPHYFIASKAGSSNNDTTRGVSFDTTIEFNITTDGVDPSIALLTPASNYLNTSYVLVNATITEANPDTAILSFNGTNYTMTCVGAVNPYCYYNATPLGDGNYSFNITANDTVNNVGTLLNEWVEVDTVAPVSVLVSPAHLTFSTTASNNFSCLGQDDSLSGLETIELYGGCSGWGSVQTNTTPLNNTAVNFSETCATGSYDWNCYVCDKAGNCAFQASNWTLIVDIPGVTGGGGVGGGDTVTIETTIVTRSELESLIAFLIGFNGAQCENVDESFSYCLDDPNASGIPLIDGAPDFSLPLPNILYILLALAISAIVDWYRILGREEKASSLILSLGSIIFVITLILLVVFLPALSRIPVF